MVASCLEVSKARVDRAWSTLVKWKVSLSKAGVEEMVNSNKSL